jgi:signal transduction histidine kinase
MPQAAPLPPANDAPQTAEARREAMRARRNVVADEQKRSFLRMVSHELRTPLNSILGFSEILAGELYGPMGAPQYKEYAGIIKASGHRLLKLVNQILEIARLEGGALDLDPRPEALDHVLDDVLDGLREEIAARQTQIVIQGEGDLPTVTADPRGLRTILTNLIQNAVTFAPDASEVRIRAAPVDGMVEIVVEDDGPGVDPADTPRLLRPFEQGENALTRRSEGAGLGLPICDLLCKAMGGRLKLESALCEGLSVHVRLPAG